ncbi:MAG: hypothetical protein A3H43_01040 [Gammaproteobacteria bacterium RIFCSPLOWO2_02_FULL_42_9]|nr:MAG: hypothetical protein A3H43_01040 [Gammaproteobacteria bacterium RIFCSPLOWO2_02_FULL_42_9]
MSGKAKCLSIKRAKSLDQFFKKIRYKYCLNLQRGYILYAMSHAEVMSSTGYQNTILFFLKLYNSAFIFGNGDQRCQRNNIF